MANGQIPLNPALAFLRAFQQAARTAQQDAIAQEENALNRQLREIQIASDQQRLIEASKTPQQRAQEAAAAQLITQAIQGGGVRAAEPGLEGLAVGIAQALTPQAQTALQAGTITPQQAVAGLPAVEFETPVPFTAGALTESPVLRRQAQERNLERIRAETAARTAATTPRSIPTQLAGFGQVGEEDVGLVFDPATGGFRSASLPEGVTGVRPKSARTPQKSLLLENKTTGDIVFSTLGEGEKVPEGFKIREKEAGDFKNVQALRKEVTSNPVIKQFTEVSKSKQRIDAALAEAANTNNFVAVDQALISSFNRLLEPDSVTMVSEYARTSADAPLINRIRANIDRVTQGGRLTDEERAALSRMSNALYGTSLNNYNQTVGWYSDIAQKQGFDPADVIQPLTGDVPTTSPTSTPTGLTPAAQEFLRKRQGR